MRFSVKMKKQKFFSPKDSTARELFWFVWCFLSFCVCFGAIGPRRQSSKTTVWRNLFQSSRISFDTFRPSLPSLLHSCYAFFPYLFCAAASCVIFWVITKNFYWRSSPPLQARFDCAAFFRPLHLALGRLLHSIHRREAKKMKEAWSEKFIL